nr:hypothetical protein [Bacteroidota bacterium]
MTQEALKLELIEWLLNMENSDTINYLKLIKDTNMVNSDWWDDLSADQKAGIERGLRDIDEGRTTSHEIVKERYGL